MVASVEFLRVPEEALANARLIAAAPDVLDALREIVALNDYAIPRSVRQRENEPRWLFAARAAIAKATGQS